MSRSLFAIIFLSLIACAIEVDISAPSLPDISDYFDISDGLTQMTIAVNYLGFCMSSMLYGPLSDSFGRRKVMLVGNFIMLIGALLCISAQSIEMLLVSRFFQGIGASTSAVLAFVIVADVCNSKQSVKIIGKLISCLAALMAIAPVLGSFVNELVGWRGNYSFVFCLSLLSWLMLLLYLPESNMNLKKFSASAATRDYFQLFCSLNFQCINTIVSAMSAIYKSFIITAPFLYMETFHLDIYVYALYMATLIGSYSLVSNFAGAINDFLGRNFSLKFGTGMILGGGFWLFLQGIMAQNNPLLTTIAFSMCSVGIAITYPLIFAASFKVLPDLKGASGSLLMASRMLFTAICISFLGAMYDGTLLVVASLVFGICVIITLMILVSIRKNLLSVDN